MPKTEEQHKEFGWWTIEALQKFKYGWDEKTARAVYEAGWKARKEFEEEQRQLEEERREEMSKWMDTFQVLAYIQERMKACGVKKGQRNGDTSERVLSIAKRALASHGKLGAKSQEYKVELEFVKHGDTWFAGIVEKKHKKGEK